MGGGPVPPSPEARAFLRPFRGARAPPKKLFGAQNSGQKRGPPPPWRGAPDRLTGPGNGGGFFAPRPPLWGRGPLFKFFPPGQDPRGAQKGGFSPRVFPVFGGGRFPHGGRKRVGPPIVGPGSPRESFSPKKRGPPGEAGGPPIWPGAPCPPLPPLPPGPRLGARGPPLFPGAPGPLFGRGLGPLRPNPANFFPGPPRGLAGGKKGAPLGGRPKCPPPPHLGSRESFLPDHGRDRGPPQNPHGRPAPLGLQPPGRHDGGPPRAHFPPWGPPQAPFPKTP